jgi:putative flippase GtrA
VKLHREVALFAVGGALGFVVDAGVVQALVSLAGWNPYLARVPSFLCAASVTWWWNRRRTFADRRSGRSAGAEWLHWVGLMGLGALINYGVYALALLEFPLTHRWPVLAVAAGSVVASAANFAAARAVLFRHPESRA